MKRYFLLGVIALTLTACQPKPSTTKQLRTDCIEKYDPSQDYFPHKTKVIDATGFTIEYHKSYKVLSVTRPWKDAQVAFRYVLVQCGAPTPTGVKPEEVVQIPARTVVSLSTTHLTALDQLGVSDRVIGVSDPGLITLPAFSDRIEKNQIQAVGRDNGTSIEKILNLSPDLVLSYGTGNAQTDSYPKLLESGVKVGLVSEYMENTPLGRAEWIKFMAAFFNREAEADRFYNQVAQQYRAIATKAQQAKPKPIAFTGLENKGTWYVPGGDSYAAAFVRDAGGTYLWQDDRSTGSLTPSFELVYDRARAAQFWLNSSQSWQTLQDVKNADARYGDLNAVKTGQMYNPTAKLNANGANEYWQTGTSNPHLVLADLVKIFHPELMRDHQFVYYKKLTP
jgi:iron complex transport system substrate-binding protein